MSISRLVDGIFLDVNHRFEELVGFSRRELVGSASTALGIIDAPTRTSALEQLHREGDSGAVEVALRRKDGTLRQVVASSQVLPIGRDECVVASFADVTEAREAQRALRRSEARYRRLVESSPDGIAVHAEGKIVYANPTTCAMIGVERPEDLLGRSVLDFVHPASRPIVIERIRRMQLTGLPEPMITEKFVRPDGKILDVEILAMPIEYEGKTAFQVVWRDVTERKRAEEALRSQTLTRALARRLVHGLIRPGNARDPVLHEIAAALVEEIHASDMSTYLAQYRDMGLGDLRLVDRSGNTYRIEGNDLLERRSSSPQPTCHLAQSFVEAAAAKLHGLRALGTEIRCQSRGEATCVFVIVARGARARPSRREA